LFSGHEWKDMRAKLTPAFTSSKIRCMVPFIVEAGDLMVQFIKRKIEESGCKFLEVSKELVPHIKMKEMMCV
jgi:cytochrome P450 family 9